MVPNQAKSFLSTDVFCRPSLLVNSYRFAQFDIAFSQCTYQLKEMTILIISTTTTEQETLITFSNFFVENCVQTRVKSAVAVCQKKAPKS